MDNSNAITGNHKES